MAPTYTLSHIDTCLPCYVQDHCNGDDEQLLSAVVDGATTYRDILDELLSELHAAELPDGADYDAAEAAVRHCFSDVTDMAAAFDTSLDMLDTDDGDACSAWFRLSWQLD